ncbi:FMN-binding negative transcriptional regulator [Kibdelosporangium aridum]|uniref:FMN-binding negative transcriptional regulator n=1 Tax=Kibdelosporangium aridum TaxID=2030 RepID=A0A428Y8X0_KIBAR|nr:FMN-binding negative transcriptional regulator [Kibdelosporangium aridum]RSM64017.1 FMN-binding negative transcriptional regulator [Kibdelosporangium aridum]
MLVHPWDAAPPAEWREWLRDGHDFGQLIVPGRERDLPVVVPTHFTLDHADENTVWLHLARPNPVWRALDERPRAMLSVVSDYTFIPSDWNGGVPTSYYAAVLLECDVRVVDDPAEKAVILNRQLGHFQPGVREDVDSSERLLSGIRGIQLTVTGATAKFKYGGNKSTEVRAKVAERLVQRDGPFDRAAARHVGETLTQPT